MPRSLSFHVQPFATEDGCLVPLRRIEAGSEAEARAIVGAMVPTVPAAVALGILSGEDGSVTTMTVIAQAGNVPEEWLAGLLN